MKQLSKILVAIALLFSLTTIASYSDVSVNDRDMLSVTVSEDVQLNMVEVDRINLSDLAISESVTYKISHEKYINILGKEFVNLKSEEVPINIDTATTSYLHNKLIPDITEDTETFKTNDDRTTIRYLRQSKVETISHGLINASTTSFLMCPDDMECPEEEERPSPGDPVLEEETCIWVVILFIPVKVCF